MIKPIIPKDIKECIVMFSGGKDSIVLIDCLHDAGVKIHPVYLYIIDYEYRKNFFQWYEKKYNVQIRKYKHYDYPIYKSKYAFGGKPKKVLNQKKYEQIFRKEIGDYYVAWGIKKYDSLERRAMLGKMRNNEYKDDETKRFYPLALFTDKEIHYYIKRKKLLMLPEYNYGLADMLIPSRETFEYLKNNYKRDYQKLKEEFPILVQLLEAGK